MSFGDANNPYGSPQQQPYGQSQPPQQPGYGYPQGQAPGYGYPQAPPVQQPYGTAVPETMPGSVGGARVMLWVIVGLQAIGTVIYAIAATLTDKADENDAFKQFGDYSSGAMWGIAVFALVWGIFAAVLATQFKSGRGGVRVTTMIWAIITAVLGVFPFLIVGIVHLVLGILIAVFVGNSKGSAWFNRPRY